MLFSITYNIFFHPLRKYPGPKSWAASQIPSVCMVLSGQPHKKILKLHQKYGDTVRIGPNELSFQAPEAWKDIMGHRSGQQECGKHISFYESPPRQNSIITANREDHSKMRRVLSHGFSAQSMLQQQPIITSYVDLLFQRLHELCEEGKRPIDMVAWYNYTTFDIIGDLAFGESFRCLENSDYHPWVKLIFDSIKTGSLLSQAQKFPILTPLLKKLVPRQLIRKREENDALARAKVDHRISLGMSRPDFAEAMITKRGGDVCLPMCHISISVTS